MGSESDMEIMKEAASILNYFGVSHELRIVSAHRTVKRMMEYAESAKRRGVQVIIAGAGGAAHLPGMVASITTLPVVGVPIKGGSSGLGGLDSLLSIVQMPAGVPVATVAINGARNAGILACQILALNDKLIAAKMEKYKRTLEADVLRKATKLSTIGDKKLLDSKPFKKG